MLNNQQVQGISLKQEYLPPTVEQGTSGDNKHTRAEQTSRFPAELSGQ